VRSADHVSVVLPYFNRADSLEEAATSVLKQTHSDLSLIMVNDASTDDSASVARSLRDHRVVHVDLASNSGPSSARNAGINQASSQLLAFMDSDDLWMPTKLEKQVLFLRQWQRKHARVAVVGCGWQLDRPGSQPAQTRPGPFTQMDVLTNDSSTGTGTPMLMVDREAANVNARFDPLFLALEDRDYVLTCLSAGGKLVVADEVLVLVRRGRGDHAAGRAASAYGYAQFQEKYERELSDHPESLSWYRYRAARAFLAHGDWRNGLRHLPGSFRESRSRRITHLVLAAVARERGLAVAQRALPLR
jgi:glycosyltransferase involved in cell wall biosynthesis